jgi:glycosyltransferase involved in cell wall biosynthesis
MTSTTFIRREIEALEALGLEIRRFAIRTWPVALVDPCDEAERCATEYLLSGNVTGLVTALLREIAGNPIGLGKSLPAWLRLRRDTGGFVRPVAYLMQASLLRQRARAEGIDHIHAHFATNATAVVMLARLMGGASYSFTAHGPDEFEDPEAMSFEPKIAHSQFVVAISDHCRERLTELGRPEDAAKIHLARCGVALEEFDTVEPGCAGDSQTLVCVGRLCPAKGQILIPEVVAALAPQFPRLRVMLVGDGESRPAVEAAIRAHGVEDRVILRGWAPNTEVRQILRESRALLLPSFAEGLPIVIMEALALGCPVISTRVAAIPELVDENCGWLVAPGDTVALAQAIREALTCSSATLAAKGAVGRERVLRRHDRRVLARMLSGLFAQAADRARGRALSVGVPRESEGRHRPDHDPKVEPEAPALDVAQVEFDPAPDRLRRRRAASQTFHLGETGHPGLDVIAQRVVGDAPREIVVVGHGVGTRTDQ